MQYILLYIMLGQFISSSLYAITLGIVPQQSPFMLMKSWAPIVKYLEQETGQTIDLKIERSIPEFENVLYSGGYDIAYMNPYHYVVANKKQAYHAKVRAKKNLTGILVVNKNSGITDIANLRGKTFLFPAPNAFAATQLIKYELLKKLNLDIDKTEKVRYVNSHDSVYKGVARGVGDAGGGIERTFNSLVDKQAKVSLIVLYKTDAYPSHPFAFKQSMPEDMQEQFTKALLNIPANLLNTLSIDEMIRTDDSEYDVVRNLVKEL